MSSLSEQQLIAARAMKAEDRADFFNKQLALQQCLWTIADEDGVMLLVSEDEDCIPVWPDPRLVDDWINEDWAHCHAQQISLEEWRQKWLPGLEEDQVEILIFPLPEDGGVVMSPWEMP